MFRKTIITAAAAAIVAASSFTMTSAAEANSRNNRIVAGIALGVAAGLLGAEINVNQGHRGNKGFHNQRGSKKGQNFKRGNFRTVCETTSSIDSRGRITTVERFC